MNEPNYGPTVEQYAIAKIEETRRRIDELLGLIHLYERLAYEYEGSQMLYAEYRATKSEPFQKNQLEEEQEYREFPYFT